MSYEGKQATIARKRERREINAGRAQWTVTGPDRVELQKVEDEGRRSMMTQNGLLIERVEIGEGAMSLSLVAREIVRVEKGSVYALENGKGGPTIGYLKIIISGAHVKAYAQKSRESARIYLGTDLDFSDAVSWALGAL